MNISCIVVEDEPLARSLLENHIQKVPYLHLLKSFSNPLEAIEFLRTNTIDLLFSDIQMPEITGITMLRILPKKPLVILTTAYSEYALEGYELDVIDYLLKPISFERFLKAAEKAAQRIAEQRKPAQQEVVSVQQVQAAADASEEYIFVKDGTKLIKVRLRDILYIEGLKDYVAIYTKEKKIVSLQTMKSLENVLPESHFIRIHNSYIVSFEGIESVDKEKVQVGKVFLPISDTYRKAFKLFIEKRQI